MLRFKNKGAVLGSKQNFNSNSGLFFMCRSCHNRSVEISVEPRNLRRTLDVYLLLFFSCKLPALFLVKEVKVAFIQKHILFGDHSQEG